MLWGCITMVDDNWKLGQHIESKKNPYDQNVMVVMNSCGKKVAYVKRTEAAILSELLTLSAEGIFYLKPVQPYQKY